MDKALEQLLGFGAVGIFAVVFVYLYLKKDKAHEKCQEEKVAIAESKVVMYETVIKQNTASIDRLADKIPTK